MVEVPSRVFVTGTGTGVGKTVAAAAILLDAFSRGHAPCAYLKPAQTGASPGKGDAAFVHAVCHAAGFEVETETVYELEEALAPAVSAELAGASLDVSLVGATYGLLAEQATTIVVEGAGGLLVPFTDDVLMADIAIALDLPLVVVSSPTLGTLNHTRLTVEAAVVRGLDVAGVVLSGWPAHPGIAEETNRARIAEFAGAPLLGVIDEIPGLDIETPGGVSAIAASLTISR